MKEGMLIFQMQVTIARLKNQLLAIEKYIPEGDVNLIYCRSNIEAAEKLLKTLNPAQPDNEYIMSRTEHLDWAKARANQYIDKSDTKGAVASFMSDMNKHGELKDHPALGLGAMLMVIGNLSTATQVKNWIDGFN